jgi:hypothetical protein
LGEQLTGGRVGTVRPATGSEYLLMTRRTFMAFDLMNYADWVKQEVLSVTPEDRLRTDWIPNWNKTLQAIISAEGIFEVLSIICARWEFLGGLYLGTTCQ